MQLDTVVNYVGFGQFVKMLGNSSYVDVDNFEGSYVDIFDETFDKQHFDEVHFIQEMASLNQPG